MRDSEEAAFQRKKLLIFTVITAVVGLIIWTNCLGEENTASCITCQKQLAHGRPDSLTVIGGLPAPHTRTGFETYYWTIRSPRLLSELTQLSQPGQRLPLTGTDAKLSTHGLRLCWYQPGRENCEFSIAQTKAGQLYTNCYSDYQFAAQPRLFVVLDSLQKTQPTGRW
jgi:hypothetical protein